MKGSLTVITW